MHSIMTTLGDPTGHPQCLKHHNTHPAIRPTLPRHSLNRVISIPAFSSIVKGTWNWAGETLATYRDGLSATERKQREDIEDRKQVLYLKIKNVSIYL